MAGDWHEATLEQLGRIVTGKTPPTAQADFYGGMIPFVTPTDFDGRRIIDSTDRNLTDIGADIVAGARIPADAVMVSCIGSDMGKVALSSRESVTNQQINSIIVSDKNDALFVYYNLSQRRAEIKAAAGGSAQPILNKTAFGLLDILLPPLPEQRAIAHILGTLDDRIEANRRMAATLEEMARALFRAWFVTFEPVRAKAEGRWRRGQTLPGLPASLYDAFPNRLVETEHGKIPEGWAYVSVGELADIKGGKQLDKENFQDAGPFPVFGGAGLMGYAAAYNADGYVITLGRVGAYCGRFFAHRGKAWVNNNASIVAQTHDIPGEWLFLALQSLDIEKIKKGAAQPFVANSDLAAMGIVKPAAPVLNAFQNLATPAVRRSEIANTEAAHLSSIRDTLLPKLVSGSIRVTDAEAFLKARGL